MPEICSRVQASAKVYWATPLQERSAKFGWIEDHVMDCDACALKLEERVEAIEIQKLGPERN